MVLVGTGGLPGPAESQHKQVIKTRDTRGVFFFFNTSNSQNHWKYLGKQHQDSKRVWVLFPYPTPFENKS